MGIKISWFLGSQRRAQRTALDLLGYRRRPHQGASQGTVA
jgi:hypothetical protein